MLRKIGKIVLFAFAGLIALGYLFIDAVSCGPVSTNLFPGHGLTGGPHYFWTFNHGCWPWDPQSPITDGTTPEKTENQVIAAWFDEKKRLIKTQKYYNFGKADWWQETVYDERGRLKSVTRGSPERPALRMEYDKGSYAREIEVALPAQK